jgi:hypothetical protein
MSAVITFSSHVVLAMLLAMQTAAPQDAETQPPTGPLPWQRGVAATDASSSPGSARELLASLGIGDAELEAVHDRGPADAAETDLLYRVLYRLTQMHRRMVETWTAAETDWQQLLDDPAKYRLHFFPISGRAKQVARVEIPVEAAEIHDLPPLWQVTIECEGAPGPVRLLSFDVPSSWLTAAELDEPVEASAMFLKIAGDENGEPEFVFAANRFAWRPVSPREQLGVEPVHVYLASRGVDIAELAKVGDRSASLPHEPFYQLLAAVAEAKPEELAGRSEPFAIVKLLKNSSQQRGHVVDVTGRALQITKILVGEPEIRERYGIDHYYEIDMFVPLETTLQLTDPNDEAKQLTYHEYPVTVCVRELPEGLSEPDKPNVFESVNTDVTLPAVFFKVWAVSTARTRKLGSDRKQFNPLFIGSQPQIVEREPFPAGTIGAIVAVVFLVALAAAWIGVWRSQRGDRKFERETLNKQFEVKPGQSLDELGIEAEGPPDFNGLAEHDTHGKPPADASK